MTVVVHSGKSSRSQVKSARDQSRRRARPTDVQPTLNPTLDRALRIRNRVIVVLMMAILVILSGRLVHLQWYNRDELARQATTQQFHTITIPARYGEIRDRTGRIVMATTVKAKSLFVNPSLIENRWQVSMQIGDALSIDPDRLMLRLARHGQKQFVWIKRRLSDEEVARVEELKLPKQIYGFRDEFLRRYPMGHLAAHVLGLRGIDGKGRGGLEQSLNNILSGRDGQLRTARDARGRLIAVMESVDRAPKNGKTVYLTIDAVIQLYAERELDRLVKTWKPRSACTIVMDPQNGELLALASRPTFDPNRPVDVPATAWTNHTIASIYEPGSTLKPLIVAWALQKKVITRDDIFDCENGVYQMGNRRLNDHHRYGQLSLTDVLAKSSNIGMAKIGERLSNKGLYQAVTRFGFGHRTGIPLPGELPGIVRPFDKWDSYSTGSIPMGHELAVTPLQLIMAHAALANGGRLISPRLVLRKSAPRPPATRSEIATQTAMLESIPLSFRAATNEIAPSDPGIVTRVTDVEIANWIVQVPMCKVIRMGTGRKAQIAEYDVFGKTGTAQKTDPVTGRYSSKLHVSSFICGAPAKNPRVLVLVVVDEPTVGSTHYGGSVAAPTAAEILRKSLIHLRVPADHDSD